MPEVMHGRAGSGGEKGGKKNLLNLQGFLLYYMPFVIEILTALVYAFTQIG